MKSPKRTFAILAAGIVSVFAAGAATLSSAAPASAATVSKTVAADLKYMREEEKLARDVYLTLDAKYGDELPTFGNIARSESKHMTAIKRLLTLYKVSDPVKSTRIGVFTNDHLDDLYDELVAQGSKSLEDALEVGIAIEKLDIADLKEARTHTTRTTIKRVYDNLTQGSENHLAAFERAMDTYVD